MKHPQSELNEIAWNSVFGPYMTAKSVLAECEERGVTPQTYTRACIAGARKATPEWDWSDEEQTFDSLVRQLGE
jgi:hypothetical protein